MSWMQTDIVHVIKLHPLIILTHDNLTYAHALLFNNYKLEDSWEYRMNN